VHLLQRQVPGKPSNVSKLPDRVVTGRGPGVHGHGHQIQRPEHQDLGQSSSPSERPVTTSGHLKTHLMGILKLHPRLFGSFGSFSSSDVRLTDDKESTGTIVDLLLSSLWV
jgi:hypothetical protein